MSDNIFSRYDAIEDGVDAGKLKFTKEFDGRYSKAGEKLDVLTSVGNAQDNHVLDTLADRAEEAKSILKTHGKLVNGEYVANEGLAEAEKALFTNAKKDFVKAEGQTISFLSGNKIDGFEHKASDELKKAFVEAEGAVNHVAKPTTGMFGILRTQKDGFAAALKHNGEKMKFWKEGLEFGQRGKAFAHGSAVVGSAVLVGDAIFRGKDAEGEDRAATTRILEAVAGGMVGTAALLGGSALAR